MTSGNHSRGGLRAAVFLFLLLLVGCQATPSPLQRRHPLYYNVKHGPVTLRWFYTDAYRVGIELNVIRDLPAGFHLGLPGCAVSKVVLQEGQRQFLLYRFPQDGQAWLDMWWHTRWSCRRLEDGSFLVSLAAFLPNGTSLPLTGEKATLTVTLGSLPIASDDGNSPPRAIPAAGTFHFQVTLQPPPLSLTWEKTNTQSRSGVQATLESVARNPSATWLDACITYPDHHFWKVTGMMQTPSAKIKADGVPLAPGQDWQGGAKALASHRCFTFPFVHAPYGPIQSNTRFRIGIEQLRIDNINPALVTARECEKARQAVMQAVPGLQVECTTTTIQGETQRWFQIVARSKDMTSDKAEQLMINALSRDIVGPWMWSLFVRPQS